MNAEERQLKRVGPGQSLWWLILGRLGLALLLMLISSAPWTRERFAEGSVLHGALPIFIAVVALSLIYAVVLRFNDAWRFQVAGQLCADVLLVTWLVWVTGDVHSPYTALYIIIIPVAGIFLGPLGALAISVACGLTFTSIMLSTALGAIPTYAPTVIQESTIQIIQTIGLNDVAFLIVGLLAARLAERQSRSDVRLQAAAQSLANLRALHERIVESIRSGVVTTDLQGIIYTFNAAAEEITGYKPGDVRGQEASIFFGNDLNEHMAESLSAASAGEASPRFESDCLTPEGLRLRLGFTISPLNLESGETTGFVITFQDLTQMRALEESSRRQDRLAAVGRMAASIAHEIRNPLAAMRGSIQVLRSEVDGDSAQGQLMDIIMRESDRLNRIITDYLTYARPRSNAYTEVDLRELLHETFTLLRHSPEIRGGHHLEEELPGEPLIAEADAERLKQVFWNLARNALQAMPGGGTLSAKLKKGATGRAVITFKDTGRGMSPAQVERLFEPFTSATGGTGLGLSIVYQIVRDHGGTINVSSREGQGTAIKIELPVVKSEVRV